MQGYDWRRAIQDMYKNLGIGGQAPGGMNFGQGTPQSPFYQQNTGQFPTPVSNYYGAPLPNNPAQPQGPGSGGGLLDIAGQPPTTTPAPMMPTPAPAPQPAPQMSPPDYWMLNANNPKLGENGPLAHLGQQQNIQGLMDQRYQTEEDAIAAFNKLMGAGAAESFGHLPQDVIDQRNQGSGGAFGQYYKPLFQKQSFFS